MRHPPSSLPSLLRFSFSSTSSLASCALISSPLSREQGGGWRRSTWLSAICYVSLRVHVYSFSHDREGPVPTSLHLSRWLHGTLWPFIFFIYCYFIPSVDAQLKNPTISSGLRPSYIHQNSKPLQNDLLLSLIPFFFFCSLIHSSVVRLPLFRFNHAMAPCKVKGLC